MSKIFRLHTGAGENIESWQEIPSHLSDNYINTMDDPAGSTANSQITSIPSPFARLDLVKTAFRYINSTKKLEGDTIYHKIVSDCLDTGEIFFNFDTLRDKIELLEWSSGITKNGGVLNIDANSDLGKLIHSPNPKHQLLGETLKMYLFQDKNAFNFGELNHIYLLNYKDYKDGPGLMNIIGGTSPTSLFFSSANNLSYVNISFGTHKLYDNQFCPIIKRSESFIYYLFAMRAAFPEFAKKFEDIDRYMEMSIPYLTPELKNKIASLNESYYDRLYEPLALKSAGNHVEILNFRLKTKKIIIEDIVKDCDFKIKSSKTLDSLIPLALPNDKINDSLVYIDGPWLDNYHEEVPFYDPAPLNKRSLPNHNQFKYPYLTVSDLFEKYLIEMPYPIDSNAYFDGNYDKTLKNAENCFALPIKKEIFNYFSIEELTGTLVTGEKMIELIEMPNAIKAVLRIPIQKNRHIEFVRIYTQNLYAERNNIPDETTNTGYIINNLFTLAIYPFIKLPENIDPHYRVAFADNDITNKTKHYSYDVSFYVDGNEVKEIHTSDKRVRRNKIYGNDYLTFNIHIINKPFSFIQIKHIDAAGIIIPMFKTPNSSTKIFRFAIDFGTTNTHVEYKTGNEDARPFDISKQEMHIATLHIHDNNTKNILKSAKVAELHDLAAPNAYSIFEHEFIPMQIGNDSTDKFPQRTVIADNDRFNEVENTYALADLNIPFGYMKKSTFGNPEITKNLKWIDFKSSPKLKKRTEGFLKELLLLIRSKVLLNNGNLEETEIIWLYPSSMPKYRKQFLETCWEKYYKRYISSGKQKLFAMSESLAPFHFYTKKAGVKAYDAPVASIDIGGGTTDIVIYNEDSPILLSSFRFAANTLFGDGYGNSALNNGFILRYERKILDELKSLNKHDVTSVTSTYENDIRKNNTNSTELIEYFFSLQENPILKENKIHLSFLEKLEHDFDMKLVFLFFYASIVYHLAKLMKKEKLASPRFLTFSGNGSKILSILANTNKLGNQLERYTNFIFTEIYESNCNIKTFEKPKELTSKGALECDDYAKYNNIEYAIKKVLIGDTENNMIPPDALQYSSAKDTDVINSITNEVILFIDSFFKWNNKFNYLDEFGISPSHFSKIKESLKEAVKRDLLSGISDKLKESKDNLTANIEETLFFYPLVGAINKLASELHNMTSN
jgi:hypothetical protein